MKSLSHIAFFVFIVTLLIVVVVGLAMIWVPTIATETNIRLFCSSLILMVASLFYIAVVDAWKRINHDANQIKGK